MEISPPLKKGEDLNLDYAKAYGCDLLWTEPAYPSVLRNAIAQKGIDVFMTELGGEGRCHSENVDYELHGLRNIQKFLGIAE